tara:strand:- start:541 stop:720 length:180 start_codon:yes stop_codon:yes gene_type:complete
LIFNEFLATPAGLEPATLCLEGRCSIQLSYGAAGEKNRRKAQGKARILEENPRESLSFW